MRVEIEGSRTYDTEVFAELLDLLDAVIETDVVRFVMLSAMLILRLDYTVPSTEEERARCAQAIENWLNRVQQTYTPQQNGYYWGVEAIQEWARIWLGSNAVQVIEQEIAQGVSA